MSMDRRTALKSMVATAVATAAGVVTAEGRPRKEAPEDAVGMLYDGTRCIGCKACVFACKKANDLPAERDTFEGGIYDAPIDLSADTKNIIRLVRDDPSPVFTKAQCMHCLDPACVSVCMLGALEKRAGGVVTYDVSRCIGCRYCQVACQFNIPKFEWESPIPRIVKCEMCSHRLAKGGEPACCEVCPRDAVIFGSYAGLLRDAKQRLADHPDRYEPRVYGETEGGGTQVLYLSPKGVPFEELGLPHLDDEPIPELAETIQHGVYRGFIAPAALYLTLGAVLLRNRNRNAHPEENGKGGES